MEGRIRHMAGYRTLTKQRVDSALEELTLMCESVLDIKSEFFDGRTEIPDRVGKSFAEPWDTADKVSKFVGTPSLLEVVKAGSPNCRVIRWKIPKNKLPTVKLIKTCTITAGFIAVSELVRDGAYIYN